MKYALCNEMYEGWAFADVCQSVAQIGYTGLEIAPFTLASQVEQLSAEERAVFRRTAESAGLEIIGLHWLFAKTEGLLATSPDASVRRNTAEYLGVLAELCGDLGGKLLVFGSPQARTLPAGVDPTTASAFFVDTIRQSTAALERHGVMLLLEPLAPTETNFLNTAVHAEQLLDEIGHPLVALHLDCKAMSSETDPIPQLIERHARRMMHFHANDPNKRGPGKGDLDFKPIFQSLESLAYEGWVSVEVFDFTPDPETIARESIDYMRRMEGSA